MGHGARQRGRGLVERGSGTPDLDLRHRARDYGLGGRLATIIGPQPAALWKTV